MTPLAARVAAEAIATAGYPAIPTDAGGAAAVAVVLPSAILPPIVGEHLHGLIVTPAEVMAPSWRAIFADAGAPIPTSGWVAYGWVR